MRMGCSTIQDVILQHAPVAMAAVGTDDEFRFLHANAAFLKMARAAGDIAGRPFADVFPATPTGFFDMLRGIRRSREPVRFKEWEITNTRSAGGSSSFWDADYIPVIGDDGEVQSIVLVCSDATEQVGMRRALEERARALQESDSRLRLALGVAPVSIFNRDRDLRTTWVYNPLLNNPVSRLIGKVPEEIYTPETAAGLRAFYGPVLERGETVHALIRLTSAWTGATKLFDMFAQPLRDERGAVCGITSAAYDLTELIETRRALAHSETFLRMALDAAQMAEWELDLQTRQVFHSSSLPRVYGLPPQEGPSSPETFTSRLQPDDRKAIGRHIADAIAAKRPAVHGQFRVVWPDGTVRWIASRSQIQYEDGKPVRVIGIEMDITEEKRTLELLQKTNAELEQFAYAASHDLKEPMRTIASFATLLERHLADALDERAREFLGFIRRGTQQMERLVNGLLDHARASQSGEGLQDVSLQDVLDDVTEQLNLSITESGASITHDSLPLVHGNRIMLSHVFQNLLSNALKFRRDDVAPQIHLSSARAGRQWVIKVQDNGVGIDPAVHQLVFEPFRRLGREKDKSGSGLGLALCKKIVEHHGGRIWLEPGADGGSVFMLTLPAAEETAGAVREGT
jgi:PAS domain S-box-containing protein